MAYCRMLRQVIRERGAQSLVYLDESGFEASTYRPYGWAPKGKPVYGERSGNTRPRTSLIVAQCGNQLLAPVLFKGATKRALVQPLAQALPVPAIARQRHPDHGQRDLSQNRADP